MNRGVFAEGLESLVEVEIGRSKPPAEFRVLDPVPLRVEEQCVVLVLKCRLTQQIEVCLRTLAFEDPLGTLNECVEGELVADTGQHLGIG
jgi:hypothetical protein